MRPAVQAILRAGFNRTQRVLDTAFDVAGLHTLTGSGIGTTSVTGGVLSVVSTTNVYFDRPSLATAPLEPGVYSVVFTVLNYTSGGVSICWSPNADMSASVDGTTRSSNATFTETLTLTQPGYIGLKGQGAAIVNALQCDNLTITRVG